MQIFNKEFFAPIFVGSCSQYNSAGGTSPLFGHDIHDDVIFMNNLRDVSKIEKYRRKNVRIFKFCMNTCNDIKNKFWDFCNIMTSLTWIVNEICQKLKNIERKMLESPNFAWRLKMTLEINFEIFETLWRSLTWIIDEINGEKIITFLTYKLILRA